MELIEMFKLFAVMVLISILARLGIYLGGSKWWKKLIPPKDSGAK